MSATVLHILSVCVFIMQCVWLVSLFDANKQREAQSEWTHTHTHTQRWIRTGSEIRRGRWTRRKLGDEDEAADALMATAAENFNRKISWRVNIGLWELFISFYLSMHFNCPGFEISAFIMWNVISIGRLQRKLVFILSFCLWLQLTITFTVDKSADYFLG